MWLEKIKMTPKVVVGTLTWNQKADVLECLRSLTKLDYPNYEIAVVDNGSTDGTFQAVRQEFPQVHVVRHSENLGCAEGVNGEVRYALQAGADYLFIIANDAIVEPSTLSELVQVAERDPTLGIVSPKVYHYGTENRIWFARGARFDWVRGRFYGFVQNVDDDGTCDNETEADYFPGGFSLVRVEAIKKTGFLDPGYFIYFDDSDWSHRIHLAGFRGACAPRARAWHKPSSALGMETPSFFYYRTRNRLYFVKKYAPQGVFPLFLFNFLTEFLFQTIPYLLTNSRKSELGAALLGIIDFLRAKQGARDFTRTRPVIFRRLLEGIAKGAEGVNRSIGWEMKRGLGQKVRLRVHLQWNVGDEIMAIPVYEALKRSCPNSSIEAEVRYPELLKGNPYVDFINQGDRFHPDRVLDLHREARERRRRDFISEIAGVSSWSEPKLYFDGEELETIRNRWQLAAGTFRIGISSSARWFARRWPRENWIELGEYFIRRFGAQLFVFGTEEEPLPVGIDLIGKTTLREAALLLNQCQLYVGSDSGLVHLAKAAGTPTVGLFGPLNPFLLTSERSDFFPLWSEVECRGCWPDHRMKYPDHCPKVLPDCMTSIPVSRVIEASEKLLAAGRAPSLDAGRITQ